MSSRKPDYRVGAMNKATDDKAIVGVAWLNDDGSIRVILNSFVRLEGSHDLILTLFPNDRESHDDNVPF